MRGLLAGVGLVVGCVLPGDAVARDGRTQTGQPQTGQTQTGRIIETQDGDTVIVHEKASVRMVKRTSGRVRIAVNQAARNVVVVMLDRGSNGTADWVWRFETDQPYPLDAPWEGAADIDEYFEPNRPGGGVGVVTPQGVIQFLSPGPAMDNPHAAPNALAILRTGGVKSGSVSGTFAALEPYWLEGRENEYRGTNGAGNFRFGVTMTGPPPPRNGSTPPPDPKP